jgi:hypothetical protein
MSSRREPLLTDVIFILVGVLSIPVAISGLRNHLMYLPGDVRSEPWFDAFVSSLQVVVGLIFLIVGGVRLVLGLRERKKRG